MNMQPGNCPASQWDYMIYCVAQFPGFFINLLYLGQISP